MIITAYAALVLVATMNCGPPPVELIDTDLGSEREGKVVASRKPPGEFRELETRPITPAVDLLRVILEKPESTEERNLLARVYREAGYLGAARFFDNSAAEMLGTPLDVHRIENDIAWTGRDGIYDRDRLVQSIASLMSDFAFAEAARTAATDLEDNGVNLRVASEWAQAVILGTS